MPASTVRSGSGQLESTLSSRDAPVQSIDTLGELGVLSFPRLQKESHSHSNATATLQRQVLRPPGSSAEDWAADWAWWQILRPPFPPPPSLPSLAAFGSRFVLSLARPDSLGRGLAPSRCQLLLQKMRSTNSCDPKPTRKPPTTSTVPDQSSALLQYWERPPL